MMKPLSGDEDSLIAYWPLNDVANGMITDVTDGAHYGTLEQGAYWTDNSPQLDIHPVTDDDGNYVLNGLYYGSRTEFEVRPFAGQRQFEPAVRRVVLTTESPVENQVDFLDISSFTVAGTVRYAGTGCAATDIPILVDSENKGTTDKKGKFIVSVQRGEHSIRPNFEDRTFWPDSLVVDVQNDVVINDASGVAFYDSTTRVLSGRVGGGCGRAIGDVEITVRSETDCVLLEHTVLSGDTAYSFILPPQNYLVSASVVTSTIPDGLVKTDVIKFFQNLGVRLAQMDSTEVEMDFVYRAPLHVAIKGLVDYKETCDGPLTFADRTFEDGLPVLQQGMRLPLRIEVSENYGASGLCALDSGIVTIFDEFSDREGDPFELEVRDGVAMCTTFVTTPSLVVGRVDEHGKDRSFQKAINAVVEIEGRDPVIATEWALVTGHVAPEGVDFVTAKGLPMPLFILRDPPGDRSFTFIEEGHSLRTTIDYTGKLVTKESGFQGSGWVGWSFGYFYGAGFGGFAGEWGLASAGVVGKYNRLKGTTTNRISSTDYTITTETTFSTSPADGFIGEHGDVFVGLGINYTFAEVGVVGVEECEVTRTTSVGFEPNPIPTTFAYAERYVSEVLIPELDSKVWYYTNTVVDEDSAGIFEAMATNWRDMLKENNTMKGTSEVSRKPILQRRRRFLVLPSE